MAELPSSTPPYVFLSYTSAERERVLAIADALETAGLTVWVDRRDLVGGSSWDTSIVHAISHCAVFILLCSADALASPNVQQEVRLAWEEQRPVLPLLLERVTIPAELRYPLAGRQWVELLDRPRDAWLADVLRALAALGIVPRAASASAANPPLEGHADTNAPAGVHLPAPLTSFIGRAQEVAEVAALLGTAHLVTLTGPGGTGKTRLALAAAAQVASAYPDGVWFVDLSGVTDPGGVVPAVAALLNVKESEGRSLAVSLAAYLRRKQLLLVLDNFEQVISAALALYNLLAEAPGLSLLVTSRVLLHVESEREYAVSPLPLPDPGLAADAESLNQNPAVRLFLERAQAHRAGFALSVANASAVAAICRRLDGLPLAIELAAARVKLLPPSQLLARLEQRLPFLTGGERNRPSRQQTLRNTIQWSWDLLSAPEQALFPRLGVFAGGFTLAAAEAVCNVDGGLDVLDVLSALVDQSLVRQGELEGEPRFSLLATLQEFALERLTASGEAAALRRAHAVYYATLAEAADAEYWQSFRLRQSLLQPLDPERDNLLGALAWVLSEQDAALGLRLGGALSWWFFVRAPGEAEQWLTRLLALPEDAAQGRARGSTLVAAGNCALARGELRAMAAYWEDAIACFRAEEDVAAVGRTLATLANWLPPAASDRAVALAEEALNAVRGAGDAVTRAYVAVAAGATLLLHGGDHATARAHLAEGLRVARALGADWITMFAVVALGRLAVEHEQFEEARALLYEGLPLAEATGDRFATLHTLLQLAQLAARAGSNDEAAMQWRRALALAQDVGSVALTVFCLVGTAELLSTRQRDEQAVCLLAVSSRLREVVEEQSGTGPQFQALYTRALDATRATLSADVFARAWAAGLALSLDEATDLALAELAAAPASPRGPTA